MHSLLWLHRHRNQSLEDKMRNLLNVLSVLREMILGPNTQWDLHSLKLLILILAMTHMDHQAMDMVCHMIAMAWEAHMLLLKS